MSITPIDIQQHRFKSGLFGYEKGGVDHFLELVADEMERIHRQNLELREELARVQNRVDEMRDREATLKETLIATQRVTEEMKSNARKEAEIFITDARIRAEKIVRDADERRIQLIGEIQEIKRQKISFETSLRALVESHMRLLDIDVLQVRGESREDRLLEDHLPFDEDSEPISRFRKK